MADLSRVRPELVAHIAYLAREREEAPTPPGWTAARARAERTFPQRWGEPDPIHQLDEMTIKSHGQDLRLRIYRPQNSTGTTLFFHGGGWVNGSVTTHDGCCIMLANQSNTTVVSVNYRKAPEQPFPAGLNDCKAALDWLIKDGQLSDLDSENIFICGESSGGNLAAVLARHARDKGIALKGQVLIYPVTDGRMNSESFSLFADGFMLSAQDLEGCYTAYVGDHTNRLDPDVSPLLADDLSGLCPAFLATCDHDPLRDEGRAYAEKLLQAGVATESVEMQGALHGIWIMRAVTPLADELVNQAADWIRQQST